MMDDPSRLRLAMAVPVAVDSAVDVRGDSARLRLEIRAVRVPAGTRTLGAPPASELPELPRSDDLAPRLPGVARRLDVALLVRPPPSVARPVETPGESDRVVADRVSTLPGTSRRGDREEPVCSRRWTPPTIRPWRDPAGAAALGAAPVREERHGASSALRRIWELARELGVERRSEDPRLEPGTLRDSVALRLERGAVLLRGVRLRGVRLRGVRPRGVRVPRGVSVRGLAALDRERELKERALEERNALERPALERPELERPRDRELPEDGRPKLREVDVPGRLSDREPEERIEREREGLGRLIEREREGLGRLIEREREEREPEERNERELDERPTEREPDERPTEREPDERPTEREPDERPPPRNCASRIGATAKARSPLAAKKARQLRRIGLPPRSSPRRREKLLASWSRDRHGWPFELPIIDPPSARNHLESQGVSTSDIDGPSRF
ncbi:MAG: hypothetical protein O7J95_10610 [Planctomycetota bacterium]|nr:hypothetical protein [Planctomycetota bacterium]